MKSELLERIKKSSKVEAEYLSDKVAVDKPITHTKIPGFNLIMSGKYDGGFYGGLTTIAAPSRHFKSSILVMMMHEWLEQNSDGVAVFYDSENGASKDMFESYGIDMDRIISKEIMNIEDLKFDIMDLLENQISKEDNIFIGIDSIGNLASKKEVEDALKENSATDMTRAKQLKSLFRMVTPYLGKYAIPMVAINHVYSEIGLFPKTIMGGGQGPLLASDSVIFLSKATDKDGKEISGFQFTLSTHKSRYTREGMKLPLKVSFENGIDRTSGLLELGLFTGGLDKKGHRYAPVIIDEETGEVTIDEDMLRYKKDINISWFDDIATNPKYCFKQKLEDYAALAKTKMISEDEEEDETDAVLESLEEEMQEFNSDA